MTTLPTDVNATPNYTPAAHADHHNALHGLNNDLDTHLVDPDPHSGYATDADLAGHAADTTAVHGITDTSQLALVSHDHDADYDPIGAATAAVTAVIDAAPGTLDTLNELAAALGDDANFASTVTTSLAGKAAASHTHVEGDLPATLATDTEVSTAVSNHAAAADPHTGYQKESEKDAANGYAGLDANTRVALAELGSGTPTSAKYLRGDGAWTTHDNTGDPHSQYATDTDLSNHVAAADPHTGYATDTDLTNHAADADPHTGYQKESEKGAASGYASLDAGTKVPTAQLGGAGADNTKFLRGDQTWAVPAGGGGSTAADNIYSMGLIR